MLVLRGGLPVVRHLLGVVVGPATGGRPMRLLVCGDRNYTNRAFVYATLDMWLDAEPIEVIIEGEAPGADCMARDWATMYGVPVEKFPANWRLYGKAAGPIRNAEMLTRKPDCVLAFHDDIEHSKGTRDMVIRARKAGITTHVLKLPSDPAS